MCALAGSQSLARCGFSLWRGLAAMLRATGEADPVVHGVGTVPGVPMDTAAKHLRLSVVPSP
jgi:hypothetical protein